MAESELCWECRDWLKGSHLLKDPHNHCHHGSKEKEVEIRVSDLGQHIINNKPVHRIWVGIVTDRMFEKYVECPWGEEDKHCLLDKIELAKKEVRMVAKEFIKKPKCWCMRNPGPGKYCIVGNETVKIIFCLECGRML